MTACRLTLVRHAEVDHAWTSRCYGQTDVPLSVHGLEQTLGLIEVLSSRPFEQVVTSDLTRCMLLAEPLSKRLGLPLTIDPRLRERDFGTWESQAWDTLWQEHGDAIHATVSEPATFRPGGGEATYELRDRVMAVISDLCIRSMPNRHEPPHVCVISHGGPIAAIVGTLQGSDVHAWHGLQPRQGEFISIAVE